MNDGGPAFPQCYQIREPERPLTIGDTAVVHGLSMRDWFAGIMQADDRLVKCIRAMDDTTLLLFAVHPQVEREEWITETGHLSGENVFYGKSEVEKVTIRLQLEANAIAKVRYMQADAMLEARKEK